jgi:hypothetical protein
MLFNEKGEILIREVADRYAGYVGSFSKGKGNPGESQKQLLSAKFSRRQDIAAASSGVPRLRRG